MLKLRVDDFIFLKPEEKNRHSLEQFIKFDAVMGKHNFTYLLGVIPKCLIENPNLYNYLVCNNKIEIAMHGINHDEKFLNEFREYETESLILNNIKTIKDDWESKFIFTNKYIPPHNTICTKTVRVLKSLGFTDLFGGPETDPLVVDYARKLGLNFHISNFPVEYGYSRELLQRGSVEHIMRESKRRDVWLTLHWTWENNFSNGTFSGLDEYLGELRRNGI